MLDMAQLRKDYQQNSLDLANLHPDPFTQFSDWFNDSQKYHVAEPNAMALATADEKGVPACRMMLLKGVDERGFLFYTHYNSLKGKALKENPRACLTFYWKEMERQVIIEGTVEKTSPGESKIYFHSRPRQNQLAAWASKQDHPLTSRQELEQEYARMEELYKDKEIPLPPDWGGYRLLPTRLEFWQGRPNRLHDRFRYLLVKNIWHLERLAP